MKNILVSPILFTVILGAAAMSCTLDRGPAGIDSDHAKEMVMTRYDQFALSGGKACEE